MFDENTINDLPQVPQEMQQEIPVEQPAAQVTQPETVLSKKPSPSESFREIRLKADRYENENRELARRIQELESRQPQSTFEIGENDLAEGKHLKKLYSEINDLKSQLQTNQQKNYQSMVEYQIKSQFPDFDKVVSADNIEMLKETEPEIAATLAANNDIYSKATATYKMMKKLGIYQEDLYSQDREKAQKNVNKPKPSSSINPQQSNSPLEHANAFANGLTDELKTKLRQEMLAAMKNR